MMNYESAFYNKNNRTYLNRLDTTKSNNFIELT